MTDEGGPRRLILLGSTGSIGVSTLDVVAHLLRERPGSFEVVALAAGANVERLAEQAARWSVDEVAVADSGVADAACSALSGVTRVHRGPDAALDLVRAVGRPGDLVVGAMVGSAGVPATLAAIDLGCDVALANKETLVAAGALVMPRVRERGVRLLPVDSEHSAVAQCLRSGRSIDEVARVVLTASGGPFRTWSRDRMERATVDEALAHPTWTMGRKITIDSASLMNKGLEMIEACWLFDLPGDRIDVIVHPPSIVHSFVEFVDGSVLAQLGPPDMRTPIQHALTAPHRRPGGGPTLDWAALRTLAFEPVDHERFPAIGLAHAVIEAGGTAGAVFNAANEVAVAAFLDGRIPFAGITALVAQVLRDVGPGPLASLEDVLDADRRAREAAAARIEAGPGAASEIGSLARR
jgi:1-deoxy-D-xylulose-5-phosphate reductoisomerase